MNKLRIMGAAAILTVVLTAMGVLLVNGVESPGHFRQDVGPSVTVVP